MTETIKVVRCDLCNTTIAEPKQTSNVYQWGWNWNLVTFHSASQTHQDVDLCPNCTTAFRNFIHANSITPNDTPPRPTN